MNRLMLLVCALLPLLTLVRESLSQNCKSRLESSVGAGNCSSKFDCIGGGFISKDCTKDQICCIQDKKLDTNYKYIPLFKQFTRDIFLSLVGDNLRNKILYNYFAKSMDDAKINQCHQAAAYFSQLAGETESFKLFESPITLNDIDSAYGRIKSTIHIN
jgi:hypothetical protein